MRPTNPILRLCLVATLLAVSQLAGPLASPAAAQVDYLYEGQSFTNADPPFSTNDRISGSIRLPAPLAPNLSTTALGTALLDYSLDDGVRTWTPQNSAVCTFTVDTGPNGAITAWSLSLRRLPLPPISDPLGFLDSSNFGDQTGDAPSGGDLCGLLAPTTLASTPNAGVWTLQGTAGAPFETTYLGEPYTAPSPPFVPGDRVSGTLHLTAPLPALLPRINIAPFVVDLAYDDGDRAWNPTNAVICALEAGTDGTGGIADWTVSLRALPIPPPGDPHRFLDSLLIGDSVGVGPAGTGPCDTFVPLSPSQSNSPGTWTDSLPPGTPTDYQYTGAAFVSSSGPWTVGDNLTGGVLLDNRLAPSLPLTDVQLGLLDYQFSDGARTWLPSNSAICRFSLATDGGGRIVDWRISLRELPLPAPGDPQSALDSNGGSDQVGILQAGTFPCADAILVDLAVSDRPGSWIGGGGSPQAIPTLSAAGLAVFVVLLTMGAGWMMRRRRAAGGG